jgi:hypothetical protein
MDILQEAFKAFISYSVQEYHGGPGTAHKEVAVTST